MLANFAPWKSAIKRHRCAFWRPRCPHCRHRPAAARPDRWELIAVGLCGLAVLASYWLIHAGLPPYRRAFSMSGLWFFLGAASIARTAWDYRLGRRRNALLSVAMGLLGIALAVWQLVNRVEW